MDKKKISFAILTILQEETDEKSYSEYIRSHQKAQ